METRILLPHKWIVCALPIAALLCASCAEAQDAAHNFPDKAIRVIVKAAKTPDFQMTNDLAGLKME
ncbi:MAG: hypothetical protein ACYCWL_17470 [Thauera sp.]